MMTEQTIFLISDNPIVRKDPKDLIPHELNETLFGELNKNEYITLREDIKRRGVQDPLHITLDNIIISGHQRRKVALDIGIKVPCIIRMDLKTPWQIKEQLISDNLLRRHLSDYQKVECCEHLREIEETRAKERMESGANQYSPVENFPEGSEGKTRDNVAERVGISGRQYDKARKVFNEAPEEIKDQWKAGKISTHNAYKQTQKQKEKENRPVLKNVEPMPTDIFDVLYADPPWKYDFQKDSTDEIEAKYPTMELEDIKKMDIPAANNSVLFLWATAPKIKEALEVMESWGFEYKTNAVWDKEWIGMGYWFRGQHEILLVGTKGTFAPPQQQDRESSVFRYKRTKHSKKPDEIRDYISKCFPDNKKIELFGRTEAEDWTIWGNEKLE